MRTWIPLLLLATNATACQTSRPAAEPAAVQAPTVSETQRANDESARKVLESIAGRELEPAGKVFENVKYLANTPARTFVQIMNGGYAKALGVTCSHCHVSGDYASDDKRPKRAAREMQTMHRMINQELGKMEHLKTPATANRAISCIACHRGMIDPRVP